MKRTNNRAIAIILVLFIILVGVGFGYMLLVPQLITDIYNGDSIPFLNNLLSGQNNYDLNYYIEKANDFFFPIFVLLIIGYLLLIEYVIYGRFTKALWQKLSALFNVEYHPVSLAMFRIALYTYMVYFAIDWVTGPQDAANIFWWSRFPKQLQFAPPGFEFFIDYIPINPVIVGIGIGIFLISCFTALIGLFSRSSALISVLTGLYVLGIPQFYGKINHYHHLLWFALLLALSPCGDVLSIDSLFLARKRAKDNDISPPKMSNRYGIPLRLSWILIGLVYLFPGYWKVATSGLEWAFSNNLQMRLYQKWFAIENFVPLLPIDRYAIIYQTSAFVTLIFEIGFIIFIFFPRIRWITLLTGQMFHFMTLFFMGIPFINLQICYVVFFEWNTIFTKIGKWLYKEDMFIIYNGKSLASRQAVAEVRAQDIFKRVVYIDKNDTTAIKTNNLAAVKIKSIGDGFLVLKGTEVFKGGHAYKALLKYIPLIIFVLPIIGSNKTRAIFEKLYQTVSNIKFDWTPKSVRQVVWIGSSLFVINFLFGFAHIHSWPFSMYPTFQTIQGSEIQGIVMEAHTADGNIIEIDNEVILETFTSDRFFPLVNKIFKESENAKSVEQRDAQLLAIWQVLAKSNPFLEDINVSKVIIYENTYTIIPDDSHLNPLAHEKLAEFLVSPQGIMDN